MAKKDKIISTLQYRIKDSNEKLVKSLFAMSGAENFVWNYDNASLLKFDYTYDVLPSSIMSRFIVKVHRIIRNNDYWFSGVVISHENCEALIEKDSEEKTIKISIAGNGNKQSLLAIIREKFESIHAFFLLKQILPTKV